MIDGQTKLGMDRYRRATKTTWATLAAHGINLLSQVAIVPLALSYLGNERYGVWTALMGGFALLAFADLGLGIGLQNAVAEAQVRDDRQAMRRAVSTCLALLLGVSVLLAAAALCWLPQDLLADRLGAKTSLARQEAVSGAQMILLCLAVGLPSSLSQRVLNGFQEGWVPKFFLMAGRLLGLTSVVLAIVCELGLPWLLTGYLGLPFVSFLAAWVWLLKGRPWLLPQPKAISLDWLKRLLRVGIGAFLVQVSLVLAGSGMPIVLAGALGAETLPPYGVTTRMMALPIVLVGAISYPLWPAYREALTRGDHQWVRSAFLRSARLGLAIQGATVVGALIAGPWAIELWTGKPEVVPDRGLVLACSAWSLCIAWSMLCMVFLNAQERMAGQAVHGLVFASLALWWIEDAGAQRGLEAAVWSLVLLCGLPRVLLYTWEVAWSLRSLSRGARP